MPRTMKVNPLDEAIAQARAMGFELLWARNGRTFTVRLRSVSPHAKAACRAASGDPDLDSIDVTAELPDGAVGEGLRALATEALDRARQAGA
jgi:hypothetical protein